MENSKRVLRSTSSTSSTSSSSSSSSSSHSDDKVPGKRQKTGHFTEVATISPAPHWSVADQSLTSAFIQPLPAHLGHDVAAGTDQSKGADFRRVDTVLAGIVASGSGDIRSIDDGVQNKRMMLENPIRDVAHDVVLERNATRRLRSARVLSRRALKNQGMLTVAKEKLRFDMFEPLHQMWLGYMREIMGDNPSFVTVQTKMLKVDLQGAFLQVIRSKCPSLVGKQGIVYRETQHTFNIITRKSKTLGDVETCSNLIEC